MKRKDLKERIRQTAMNEIPDVFDKIHLDSIQIEPKTSHALSWQRSFKLAVSAFVIILVGFFTFQMFIQQPTSDPFQTDIELLAFQTVSAQSLIEYNDTSTDTLSLIPLSDDQLLSTDASDVEAYLDDMSPMIELAELLINQRDQIQYNEMDSDRDDYEKRIRFTAVNLLEETIEFDIYYNELDDEVEGIVVQAEKTYYFNQNLQRLRLFLDDDTYIDVEESASQNIHQFNFHFYRQEQEVFSTRIDMILENSQFQANFKFDNKMGMTIQMQMKRNMDQSMEVEYEVRDNARELRGRFNVLVQNDDVGVPPFYRFKFDDDSEIESNRPSNQTPGPGNQDPGPGNQEPGPPNGHPM